MYVNQGTQTASPSSGTQTHLETVLEAVGGRLVAAVSVLLPPLTEQQSSLVQEQVALHRFEASQLLHARGTFLMADPHAEGALHQHPAQLTHLTLRTTEGDIYVLKCCYIFVIAH